MNKEVRDAAAAHAAVHMASEHRKVAGIAVNDDAHAVTMLEKVKRAASTAGIMLGEIKTEGGVTHVNLLLGGEVRVIPADKLTGGN